MDQYLMRLFCSAEHLHARNVFKPDEGLAINLLPLFIILKIYKRIISTYVDVHICTIYIISS